jgi:parvulin-like peptidyl-prolyl isomerase
MFETLRRMIFPIIIIVLIFFVAMIVLEWGLDFTGRGGQMAGGGSYAAEINGEKVPLEYYNQIYNNLYQNQSQQSTEELTDDQVAQIKEQAWTEMLQDRLLTQEADRHNITVSEKDIFSYLASAPPDYIRNASAFQTNGQFDYQKYTQALADPNWSSQWNQLEPALRSDLLKMKMQQIVIEAATVSEQEIRQAMLDNNEKVTVGVITVSAVPFISQLTNLPESDISAYYEEHKSDYTQQERAALDLVTANKTPSELDVETARQKAQTIYDSIKAGEDFVSMAERYSEDPGSATQGGDLGWFAPGAMVQAFDSVSFSAKEGELVAPIRTPFGWHIIKHFGYRTDEEIPENATAKTKVRKAHVAHILVKIQLSQETRDLAIQKLSAFAQSAREKDFQTAAKDLELTAQTTPPFFKGYQIQTIGPSPAAHAFAFSNDVGAISGVLETPQMFFVARVAQRIPAGVPPLTEVHARVANELKQSLARKIAMDTAALISSELRAGGKPEAVAGRHKLSYEVLPPFARNTGMSGLIGRDPNAIGAAFALTTPGQISDPVSFGGGAAVMILIERQSPNLDQLNQKRDSVKQSVLYQKQSELYSKWFEQLVKNSQITNYVEQMERAESQLQ